MNLRYYIPPFLWTKIINIDIEDNQLRIQKNNTNTKLIAHIKLKTVYKSQFNTKSLNALGCRTTRPDLVVYGLSLVVFELTVPFGTSSLDSSVGRVVVQRDSGVLVVVISSSSATSENCGCMSS